MGKKSHRPRRLLESLVVAVALVTTTTGATDHDGDHAGGSAKAEAHRSDHAHKDRPQHKEKGTKGNKDKDKDKDNQEGPDGSAEPTGGPTASPRPSEQPESHPPSNGNANGRQVICHATSSDTRPYHRIELNVNGVLGGHTKPGPLWSVTAKADGTRWADIIPPFDYNNHGTPAFYPGLNWTAAGRAIFAAGCEVTRPVVSVPSATPSGEKSPVPLTGGEGTVHAQRSGGALAFTGAPLDVLAKLAPLNLVLGLVLLAAGRRRRSSV